jgi:hypothetical protein
MKKDLEELKLNYFVKRSRNRVSINETDLYTINWLIHKMSLSKNEFMKMGEHSTVCDVNEEGSRIS